MVFKLKKIRKMTVLLLVMCLLISGCSKSEKENTNDIDYVQLKSNQEIVTCKITAIYGNEIEYTVAKEQSVSDTKKDKMPSSSGAPDMKGGDMPSSSGAPDMQGGDMSSSGGESDMNNGNNDNSAGGPPDMGGDMSQGVAPDMNGDSSDSKQGNASQNSSDSKNSSSDSSGENKSDKSKSSKNSDKKVYTLTDETGSTTIPVGTDVITSLGKTTTFSRLSNGDIIKMIMEKDSSGEKVVVGVWIVS